MGLLSFLTNVYMIVISVRIILTWFGGIGAGGFQDLLAKVTDPYLDWFRRFPAFRVGFLDLSPIVALGFLSLVNRIFSVLAFYGTITIGIILAIALQVVWGAVSFFFGFLIIILILRLVCHLLAQNIGNPFWRIVDAISNPVLYRINRFLFKGRIVNFITGNIAAIASLGIGYIGLKIVFSLISGLVARLPI
jgi:YggT family protein